MQPAAFPAGAGNSTLHLREGNKGKPAVMFGASLVYIPACQA